MTEKTDPPRPEVKVPILLAGAAAWGWRILAVAAALTVLAVIFLQLYVVIVPVVLALFLAAALEPAASWLRRRRWPAALAATAVFLGALLVLLMLLAWIGASVAGQFDDVGAQLTEAVEDAKDWASGDPLNLDRERIDELETDIRNAAQGATGGLARQAAGRARAAGEVLGGLVLLLFTLFFLLKDGAKMADWLRQRVPPAYQDDVCELTSRSRRIMRQYLIATAATGFIDGILIGVALWVLGVPLVIPLAVLTFLGGFIPIVGATVAGLVASLVALVTNGVGTALLVVAATVAVQQIEGNLLQPLILERAVRLHPLVTVWAVAAGLVVGGLLGAFLSVPLIAIVVGAGSYYRRRNEPPEPAPVPVPNLAGTDTVGLPAGREDEPPPVPEPNLEGTDTVGLPAGREDEPAPVPEPNVEGTDTVGLPAGREDEGGEV